MNKKFVVYNPSSNEDSSGAKSPPYKCLTDCPQNYPYYSIITSSDFPSSLYACKNSCPAYITNINNKINEKLCFDDEECSGNNPYFIKDENN